MIGLQKIEFEKLKKILKKHKINGLTVIGLPLAAFGWTNFLLWLDLGQTGVAILFALMGGVGSLAVIDDLLFKEKIAKFFIDHIL